MGVAGVRNAPVEPRREEPCGLVEWRAARDRREEVDQAAAAGRDGEQVVALGEPPRSAAPTGPTSTLPPRSSKSSSSLD